MQTVGQGIPGDCVGLLDYCIELSDMRVFAHLSQVCRIHQLKMVSFCPWIDHASRSAGAELGGVSNLVSAGYFVSPTVCLRLLAVSSLNTKASAGSLVGRRAGACDPSPSPASTWLSQRCESCLGRIFVVWPCAVAVPTLRGKAGPHPTLMRLNRV